MKKNDLTRIILLITSLLMLVIGFVMSKSNIEILILGILAIISLVVLDRQASDIVKLSKNNPKVKTFRFLNMFTLLIVVLCFILALSSSDNQVSITEDNKILIIGLMSAFMMIFGNSSPKIPFNRYLGLRLPWTIRDEEIIPLISLICAHIRLDDNIFIADPRRRFIMFHIRSRPDTSFRGNILLPHHFMQLEIKR